MNANELRIGNYLQDAKGRLCRVEKLGVDDMDGVYAPALKGVVTSLPLCPIELDLEKHLSNLGFKIFQVLCVLNRFIYLQFIT